MFYTMAASGKVKRMRQNRRVRVAPCDARGNVKGEWAEGSARSLQDEGARQADRMLDDKYGWQRPRTVTDGRNATIRHPDGLVVEYFQAGPAS